MKILMGVYRRDAGEILLSEVPADIDSPAAAESLGIRMIYQEPELIPELTVAENIFLNTSPCAGIPA
jgi:ABC-type sugar transport system ATPase subunit